MLKEIKNIINEYAEEYSENYMSQYDFVDGENVDGSPTFDDETMHQQALWELANSVSHHVENYGGKDYTHTWEDAHRVVLDIVDTAEEYIEALPKVKLPETTTLNKVLNALTSRMAKGMDAYEAFTDAEKDKDFGNNLHKMVMGWKE